LYAKNIYPLRINSTTSGQAEIFQFLEGRTDSGHASANNQDGPEASTSAGSCEEKLIQKIKSEKTPKRRYNSDHIKY
jgi:hypothetical protein